MSDHVSDYQELLDRLVDHDFYYRYTEDPKVLRHYRQNWERIIELASNLDHMDIVNDCIKAIDAGRNPQNVVRRLFR